MSGLPCHAGSLKRLSALAGARSDVPRTIEATSCPNDPTRSATVSGRRARFNANLLHDVSGIILRATPVAEVVKSRSSGTAISSAFGVSLPDIVSPSILVWCECVSREQGPRHDDALDLVGALVDLGDLGVAHHALNRKILGVARTAEQLHGVSGSNEGLPDPVMCYIASTFG